MVEDSATRTVPIKLDVDESAAGLLHQTTDYFLDAANYVVNVAWEPDWKITSKTKLHDLTYYDVRDDSPLPANLVQAARNRAAEAVKGVVERWKDGKKASKPYFTSRFASYDARTVTVNADHCTLATIDGRVTADFVLPDEQRDTPHSAYLFNDDYDVKGATLHYDTVEDCFYLHVRTKPTVENDNAGTGDAKHTSPSLVSTSASQTSQPPQPDVSGAAENSTTGIENEKRAVAISNKLGLDGHTRTFSESVASKPDVSNRYFTRSRTNWWRKLSKTTAPIWCSSNSTASANAYRTRRQFTSGRSIACTSTSRTKPSRKGLW